LTTIAYRDGILAADNRATYSDGTICATRTTKIYRLENKALFGCTGDADQRELLALLSKASPKRLPTKAELCATKTDSSGLLVFPNGRIFNVVIDSGDGGPNDWTAQIMECKERFWADGSGYKFALGAMAAGRSAKQAVEIACRFDSNSGLPVLEVPLKPPPKSRTKASAKAKAKPKRKAPAKKRK
jgi:ATP-dependent HslUV protease subunit HslV